MSKYLNSCSDLVFKKVFGSHPRLLISFLNAILPLPEDGLIESIEYLQFEHVPVIPEFKSTVVDVKCTDQKKRIFIVEMQISWVPSFQQRMLFNASSAYVKQLKKGEEYALLNPVYGLAILCENFDPDPAWYHHYQVVNIKDTNKVIKDLQLIFLELKKFKAQTWTEKKLAVLWLRFMAEINENTKIVDPALLAVQEIKEAVALAEEAAYTKEELEYYDRYWDSVSREKTLILESEERGEVRGKEIGKEIGIGIGIGIGEARGKEIGMTLGAAKEAQVIAKKLIKQNLELVTIANVTGIEVEELKQLVLAEEIES